MSNEAFLKASSNVDGQLLSLIAMASNLIAMASNLEAMEEHPAQKAALNFWWNPVPADTQHPLRITCCEYSLFR